MSLSATWLAFTVVSFLNVGRGFCLRIQISISVAACLFCRLQILFTQLMFLQNFSITRPDRVTRLARPQRSERGMARNCKVRTSSINSRNCSHFVLFNVFYIHIHPISRRAKQQSSTCWKTKSKQKSHKMFNLCFSIIFVLGFIYFCFLVPCHIACVHKSLSKY